LTDCTLHEYKRDPCVQVKNKPCVECIITMRIIPWNHSQGGETRRILFSMKMLLIIQ
jgi:hypothetical protein